MSGQRFLPGLPGKWCQVGEVFVGTVFQAGQNVQQVVAGVDLMAFAVFNVEGEVVLRESVGMKTKELSKAEELANENRSAIIQKWHEYFN